jgi:hypothetical protein
MVLFVIFSKMKTIHNWHLNISNDKVETVFLSTKAHPVPCQRGKQDTAVVATPW